MEIHWQTTRNTIRERNQYMFNSTLISDIEFSVVNPNADGITINIPAHKYVLAISSPVFEAMFFGDLAETSRTISLPDCTAEGLRELFRYLYCDEVVLTGSIVMEVLYLAKKYIVPSLVDKCTLFLEEKLEPHDVFTVLPEAVKQDDEKLQQLCWNCVDLQTQTAMASEPFVNINQELLCEILERDLLEITELELFQAVDRWAEHKIEQRKLSYNGESKRLVLGDKAVHLIRFPLLSMDQLVEHVLPADILTKEEIVELFTYYGSSKKPTLQTFNEEQRKGRFKHNLCKRFRSVDRVSGWGYTRQKEDAITFYTDKKIHLTGARMCGERDSKYKVIFKIYKGDSLIMSLKRSEYESDDGDTSDYYGFVINFKPVCIESGVQYTLLARIEGPMSYKGVNGMSQVQCDSVKFTFVDQISANGTSATIGQFPELMYSQLL